MILELHKKLKNKEISATELAQNYLNSIKEKDEELNAFIKVTDEMAMATAAAVDDLIAGGQEIGILAGLPVAIKDNILVKDVVATAGSKILQNYVAPYDATVVAKLKEQGMVLLGKTNLDEFGMGSSTENSAFLATKNPYDLERVPGGSSGGSAVAVAAGMAVYALGTDTGGSIRQPASFCGVCGLKPTYGACSRYGLVALASSLDQPGPLAKSVEDVKMIFTAMTGKDNQDATSFDINKEKKSGLELKVGVPKEYFKAGVGAQVKDVLNEAIKKLEDQGVRVQEVSLPMTAYALAVYYIIMPAEASANLARYDGVRYGSLVKDGVQNLFEVYSKSRAQFLGDEVKRRIMLGTYALSAGYFDAYYKKAQQVRTLIKQDFVKVFEKVDALLTPVSPTAAWKMGEKISDPLQMYMQDVMTVPASVAGVPALSVPVGKTDDGLPVGAQLIGSWHSEDLLFEIGKLLEV